MPYDVVKRGDEWCVVKATTGKKFGCHPTESKANAQLKAILASTHGKELGGMLFALITAKESSVTRVEKQDDRYRIVTVSTAALEDREGETFTTEAMDFDIRVAKETGEYPEFRLWHTRGLGIGKVTKMSRVGIFAVDEGLSYDDPFSLQVCEKMLANNDGTWRVSRGFYTLETSGGCPHCGEGLVVGYKHLVAGFKCPGCGSYYPTYKSVLRDVKFRKTRTFDVTITDNPAVLWTSAGAFSLKNVEEVEMTKKQLAEKLRAAGLDDAVIKERLSGISIERLKELDDIPDAMLLKELEVLEEEEEEDDEDFGMEGKEADLFILDPDVLRDFAQVVRKEVHAALDGLTIDVDGLQGMDIQVKELENFNALADAVIEIKEVVDDLQVQVASLLESDEKRLKELLEDTSRSSRLRILRTKAGGKKRMVDEDEDEDEEDEDEQYKQMPAWFAGRRAKDDESDGAVIAGGDGRSSKSMTEFLRE